MPVVPLQTNNIVSSVFLQGDVGPVVGHFTGWRLDYLRTACEGLERQEVQNNLALLNPDLAKCLRAHLGRLHSEANGSPVKMPVQAFDTLRPKEVPITMMANFRRGGTWGLPSLARQ